MKNNSSTALKAQIAVPTSRLNQNIDILRLSSKHKKLLRKIGIDKLSDFPKCTVETLYKLFDDKTAVDLILQLAAGFGAYCHGGHLKEEAKVVVMPTVKSQEPAPSKEIAPLQKIEKPSSRLSRNLPICLQELMEEHALQAPWYFDIPVTELKDVEEVLETFTELNIQTIGDFTNHDWNDLSRPQSIPRNLWQDIRTQLELQGVVFRRNCENLHEVEKIFQCGDEYWSSKPDILATYGGSYSEEPAVAVTVDTQATFVAPPPVEETSMDEQEIYRRIAEMLDDKKKEAFLTPIIDFPHRVKSGENSALYRFARNKSEIVIVGQVAEQSRKDLSDQKASDTIIGLIEKELNQVGLELGYREKVIKRAKVEKQIQNAQNHYNVLFGLTDPVEQDISEEEKNIYRKIKEQLGQDKMNMFMMPIIDFPKHARNRENSALCCFAQNRYHIVGQVAELSEQDLKSQHTSNDDINAITKELRGVGLDLGYREKAMKKIYQENQQKLQKEELSKKVASTQNYYGALLNFKK